MTSIISRSLSTSRESKLQDFLKEFGESTDPHVLGAYFGVDQAILRKLEEDYQDDTRRQMGEVIKYLLLNYSLDPQLLWKTLMQAREAVQRIESGGHAHLTNTLSGKYHGEIAAYEHTNNQRVIQALECVKKERKSTKESSVVLLDSTVKRNILILGKNGEGKSTLGNRVLKCRHFKINSTVLPQTHTGKSAVKSQSQLKTYKFKIYDHDGLFDMKISTAMSSLFNANDELHLNIVLFVMKQGHFFDRNVQQTLETIMTMWPDISRISVLVVTHCERLSEEERKEVVQKIKMIYPAIANFMKVGIITVGFPDQDYVRDEQSLADSTDRDTAKLRTLIYFSEGRLVFALSVILLYSRYTCQLNPSVSKAIVLTSTTLCNYY